MRICFFIWGLRAAGAERVLSSLANDWAAQGHQIVILVMEDGHIKPFYDLDPTIELRPLNILKDSVTFISAIVNNITRIYKIRRAIIQTHSDVLISFIDKSNILAIIASRGLGLPIIISERTDPSRRSLGRVWETLRSIFYSRANVVVFQSQAVMNWFPVSVQKRGVVIPNPVIPLPLDAVVSRTADSNPRIVAMGRLFPVKGFDILLTAFAATSSRLPHWHLDIWGEGPERDMLQDMVCNLGLSDRVHLRGITHCPLDVLRSADIFILPSRVEGFPNALLEAMSCGLPIISTNFGEAAKDIVRDGVDGILVPPNNPEALASAMVLLMSSPTERARLAERAPDVMERFSKVRVLSLWDQAINQAISQKKSEK